MEETASIVQKVQKTLHRRFSKKKASNGQTSDLYEDVITKNFQIISDLLKKLNILFNKQDNSESEIQLLNKKIGKLDSQMENIHAEHRRDNMYIYSSVDSLKGQLDRLDDHVKRLTEEIKEKDSGNIHNNTHSINFHQNTKQAHINYQVSPPINNLNGKQSELNKNEKIEPKQEIDIQNYSSNLIENGSNYDKIEDSRKGKSSIKNELREIQNVRYEEQHKKRKKTKNQYKKIDRIGFHKKIANQQDGLSLNSNYQQKQSNSSTKNGNIYKLNDKSKNQPENNVYANKKGNQMTHNTDSNRKASIMNFKVQFAKIKSKKNTPHQPNKLKSLENQQNIYKYHQNELESRDVSQYITDQAIKQEKQQSLFQQSDIQFENDDHTQVRKHRQKYKQNKRNNNITRQKSNNAASECNSDLLIGSQSSHEDTYSTYNRQQQQLGTYPDFIITRNQFEVENEKTKRRIRNVISQCQDMFANKHETRRAVSFLDGKINKMASLISNKSIFSTPNYNEQPSAISKCLACMRPIATKISQQIFEPKKNNKNSVQKILTTQQLKKKTLKVLNQRKRPLKNIRRSFN